MVSSRQIRCEEQPIDSRPWPDLRETRLLLPPKNFPTRHKHDCQYNNRFRSGQRTGHFPLLHSTSLHYPRRPRKPSLTLAPYRLPMKAQQALNRMLNQMDRRKCSYPIGARYPSSRPLLSGPPADSVPVGVG